VKAKLTKNIAEHNNVLKNVVRIVAFANFVFVSFKLLPPKQEETEFVKIRPIVG